MNKIVFIGIMIILSANIYSQKIYVSGADSAGVLKVFVTNDTLATNIDLLVYQSQDSTQVTKDGIWYEVSDPQEADLIIYYVHSVNPADLVVLLIPYPQYVSWINPSKRLIYKTKNKKHNCKPKNN